MDLSAYFRERYLSKIWLYFATITFFIAVMPILVVYYGLIAPAGIQAVGFGVVSLLGFSVTAVALYKYWQHTRRESAELA